MTRTRFCVTLVLVALVVAIAAPARAEQEKADGRNEVRVEMNAAGAGQEAKVRMWVNGEEVQPGDPVPAGTVGRLEAESIADPDAGMGGKKAGARTHTRVEVKPDRPGGEPRVRMWVNGKEMDPGDAIQLGQGKARIRLQASPEGRREGEDAPGQAALGVRITELTDDLARKVGVDAGVAVMGTVGGSPAEYVGLRMGDVITAIDGKEVGSPDDLIEHVTRREPGSRVRIEWHRPKAKIEATVPLAGRGDMGIEARARPEPRQREEAEAREREQAEAREREARRRERAERERAERKRAEREERERAERAEREAREPADAEEAERDERPAGFLGVLAAPLNDDIREIAGTDKGVLINSLTDDSPAAKAGLKPGDVIVRIGDTNIDRVDQLVEILGDRKPGDRIHVVYYRMGKRRETEVTLGRRPGQEGEAREPEGMPSFDDLFGGEMPNLREYLERLRPQMEEWARRFREERGLPEARPPRPEGEGEALDRILERLERIERRLDRMEERMEQGDR